MIPKISAKSRLMLNIPPKWVVCTLLLRDVYRERIHEKIISENNIQFIPLMKFIVSLANGSPY